MEFVSINRVLGKLNRELRGTDLPEGDLIEWIGEALEFMSTPYSSEERVAYLKVENYECNLPDWLKVIYQIVKYEKEVEQCDVQEEIEDNCDTNLLDMCSDDCVECCDGAEILTDYLMGTLDTSYRPYFDMNIQFLPWSASYFNRKNFSIVRLANHTFFKNIVCQDKAQIYHHCPSVEEYTIIGTTKRKLRFSFKEGYVAISYLRSAIEDGLPLIPDNVYYIDAATYYCRWKIAEHKSWNRVEGYDGLADRMEKKWQQRCKQAKNYAMMPKGVDEYQNLLEQSLRLVPRKNQYYSYFGNLSRFENINYER